VHSLSHFDSLAQHLRTNSHLYFLFLFTLGATIDSHSHPYALRTRLGLQYLLTSLTFSIYPARRRCKYRSFIITELTMYSSHVLARRGRYDHVRILLSPSSPGTHVFKSRSSGLLVALEPSWQLPGQLASPALGSTVVSSRPRPGQPHLPTNPPFTSHTARLDRTSRAAYPHWTPPTSVYSPPPTRQTPPLF
jgi:hypothetical protein